MDPLLAVVVQSSGPKEFAEFPAADPAAEVHLEEPVLGVQETQGARGIEPVGGVNRRHAEVVAFNPHRGVEARQCATPINLGSSELVSVNDLLSIVEEAAGFKVKRTYDPAAPQGVGGRNSDNTMIKRVLGWEPSTPLRVGMAKTYRWIEEQFNLRRAGHRTVA